MATAPDTPAARLHAALGRLLHWGQRAEIRRDMLGAGGAGLTPTEVWLIETIAAVGPVRSSDLAARHGVDKSTMTPPLKRLQARGLVTREPDPQDGRAALLTLSPAGRKVVRGAAQQGTRALDDVLAAWSEADRERLAVLFTRLVDDLERPAEAQRSASS